MEKLTKKQKWMYNYVRSRPHYVSPTEVGREYGLKVLGVSGHHSSTASPTLLKLTKIGLLIRSDNGHYVYNPTSPTGDK